LFTDEKPVPMPDSETDKQSINPGQHQSLDWCKNPVFPTNYLAGTSEQNQKLNSN